MKTALGASPTWLASATHTSRLFQLVLFLGTVLGYAQPNGDGFVQRGQIVIGPGANAPRDLNPFIVGGSNPSPQRGFATAVAVEGRVAYCGLDNGGVAVFDVRNPAKPERVDLDDISTGYVSAAVVFSNYLCVTSGGGLSIFDLSMPAQPRLLATVQQQAGRWDSGALAIAGRLACVTLGYEGLQLIDLANPARPILLGWLDTTGYAAGIAITGNYALVADGDAGVQVIDLGDPTRPTQVGSYITPGFAAGVAVQGSNALVLDYSMGLVVLDVSNPPAPRHVGELAIKGAHKMLLSGSHAYVEGGNGTINVIDLGDPANPAVAAGPNLGDDWITGMTVSAGYLYAATRSGLRIYEIGSSHGLTLIGGAATAGFPYDLVLRDHHAIVAEGDSGLQVIDVSNPSRARRIGGHTTLGKAVRVAMQGDTVLTLAQTVADRSGPPSVSLEIFDVSQDSSPFRLGGCQSVNINTPAGLAVSGTCACVIGGDCLTVYSASWLEIIDISQLETPRFLSALAFDAQALCVLTKGTLVYVGLADRVQIVDLSNPSSPQRIGTVPMPDGLSNLALHGHTLLVGASGYSGGMTLVDVSDPARPRVLPPPSPAATPCDFPSDARAWVLNGTLVHHIALGEGAQQCRNGVARLVPPVWTAALFGERLLVMGGYPGDSTTQVLQLIDFNRWANPQRIGASTNGWAGSVAVSSNHACVLGQRDGGAVLELLSLQDPAYPRRVGDYWLSGHPSAFAVNGARAYLTFSDKLEILDISYPVEPRMLGTLRTNAWFDKIAVSDTHAFVTHGSGGVSVIDVGNPARPVRVASYGTIGTVANVDLAGNVLLLAVDVPDGRSELQLLDVSTPAQPVVLGTLQDIPVRDISVSGTRVILVGMWRTDYRNGMVIVDISNPAHPREVSRVLWRWEDITGVTLAGPYAYVLMSIWGLPGWLEVFDVSDLANPRRVGGNSVAGGNDIAAAGQYLLIAGEDGLTILNEFVPLQFVLRSWQPAGFGFSLNGPAGWPVRVQRSADLVIWQDWLNVTLGSAPLELGDPEAVWQPCGFYRILPR